MLKQILTALTIGAVGVGTGFVGGAVYKDKTIDVTQKDEYKQVVDDNNDLSTKLDTTKLALKNLTTQRDNLEATKKQLEAQLTTAQKQLSDKTAELETKQAGLESADEQIRALNTQISTLKTDAEANAEQITELQGQITTLTDTKTSLEKDIGNLQNEVDEYNLQISDLQDSISSKDSTLQALNDKISKLYKGASNYTKVGFDVEKRFNLTSNNYRLNYMQMPNNKIIMTVSSINSSYPISDENKGLWEFDPLLDTLERIDKNILYISPIENTKYFVSQSENTAKLCFANGNGEIEELGQFSVDKASVSDNFYVYQSDDNLVFNIISSNKYYMICVDKTNNTFKQYAGYTVSKECFQNILQLRVNSASSALSYAFYNVDQKKFFYVNGSSSFKLFTYSYTLNGLIWAQGDRSDSVTNTLRYYDFANETYSDIPLSIENVKVNTIGLRGIGSDVLISYSENNEVKVLALNLDTKIFKDVTIENTIETYDPSYNFINDFKNAQLIGNKYYGISTFYNGSNNAPCLFSYDKDLSIIKIEEMSGSIPSEGQGGISVGTVVRNDQMYKVWFSFTESPNDGIAWASINIYKLDLEAMSVSFVATQYCSRVMGKSFTKVSFEIVDDEDTITLLANTGYTYVYDFKSLKECGKTELELEVN